MNDKLSFDAAVRFASVNQRQPKRRSPLPAGASGFVFFWHQCRVLSQLAGGSAHRHL